MDRSIDRSAAKIDGDGKKIGAKMTNQGNFSRCAARDSVYEIVSLRLSCEITSDIGSTTRNR